MRKYICITYHMAKLDGETAETCIDLAFRISPRTASCSATRR